MPYSRLDPAQIVKTIRLLERRIVERFPDSGLAKVCSELHDVAAKSCERAERIARSHAGLRLGVGLAIALVVGALVLWVLAFDFDLRTPDLASFVQIFEAAANSVVLVGAALVFLVTIEARFKRGRALKALNELRAFAHVVDMHQLTKDPERSLGSGVATPSSPTKQMSAFLLSRYLDYSSEMLSLIGKIASVYGQTLNDAVVVTAVNEIEGLVTGLSRKIWQKIMILQILETRSGPLPVGDASGSIASEGLPASR